MIFFIVIKIEIKLFFVLVLQYRDEHASSRDIIGRCLRILPEGFRGLEAWLSECQRTFEAVTSMHRERELRRPFGDTSGGVTGICSRVTEVFVPAVCLMCRGTFRFTLSEYLKYLSHIF